MPGGHPCLRQGFGRQARTMKITVCGFGLGLRLGSQFGQWVKVMANDLKPIALTQLRNRHPYPDLSPETLFST